MKPSNGFESFPSSIVLLMIVISISVYLTGIYLLYLIWDVFSLLFLFYIIYIELSVYNEGCKHCYYYGKMCAFGRGKIAKVLFKKGDPKKFFERSVGFKDFIPSMLVSVIPIIAGIYLLIQRFDFIILGLTVWPIVVFFSNQFTYGRLICPNCKQGKICCPACEFFMKTSKK